MLVRPEYPADVARIRAIAETAFAASAFGHHGEADLIERLRAGCSEILSLVAECEGEVVGHVLFSPVAIHCDDGRGGGATCTGMGLGPLAVLPEYQRRGIGSRLVEEGLARLRQRDCPFVCVLGDPTFYGRLGFQPAAPLGILCEFGGADDGAFQIRRLGRSPTDSMSRRLARWGCAPASGLAKYRREFCDLGHEPRR
jgi:predicted N-acetyltransferase YhbS